MSNSNISNNQTDNAADFTKQAKFIFGICCVGYFFSLFFRMAVGVISPDLVNTFNLTSSELSSLAFVHSVAFVCSQVLAGYSLDKFGVKNTMFVWASVNILGILCFAFAPNYFFLILGRVLMGAGTAVALTGTFMLVGNWFKAENFANIASLCISIGMLGQMLSSAPLAILSAYMGWRGAILFCGAIVLIQLIFLFVFVKDSPTGRVKITQEEYEKSTYMALFKIPEFWFINYMVFIFYGLMLSFVSVWGGVHFMYGLGFSQITAGDILFFSTFGYFLGVPFFAWLSNRLEIRARLIIPSGTIIAILLFIFCSFDKDTSLYVFRAFNFFLGFFAATSTLGYTLLREALPKELTAKGITCVSLSSVLGAAVVVQLGGLMFESDLNSLNSPEHFRTFWNVLAFGILLAVIFSFRLINLRKRRLRELKESL